MTTEDDDLLVLDPDFNGARTLRGFRVGLALGFGFWFAVIAAGAAVSHADGVATAKVDCGSVPMPPAQYDHTPEIAYVVRHYPFWRVDKECRAHGVGGPAGLIAQGNGVMAMLSRDTGDEFTIQACSWTNSGIGFVVLPNESDVGAAWNACALRHEMAHLNHWPATHPDAHYE